MQGFLEYPAGAFVEEIGVNIRGELFLSRSIRNVCWIIFKFVLLSKQWNLEVISINFMTNFHDHYLLGTDYFSHLIAVMFCCLIFLYSRMPTFQIPQTQAKVKMEN